jgi:rSAM/selenodomain-associated transferase 1
MIMVKEPVAGQVKTRLAASIGSQHALALYQAFIADTLALARQVPETDVALVYWPEQARSYFEAICPDGLLLPQRGHDLGDRLLSAFEQAHAAGYERCVIMSSDSPNLPLTNLVLAFEQLDTTPVVLGPCDDGGYYLIGLRQPQPTLFQDIAWSTEVVYRQTVERSAAAGLEVATLPTWYDIDTNADLERLHANLRTRPPQAISATLDVLDGMAQLSTTIRGEGEEHNA